MIVTKRESMASLIHDTSPTLRHGLQQSHNKGLYYGFRDAVLSRLVTIIKCLVHHAVYCISLSCLLSFLCNPYIPFLIYEIFHLLVFNYDYVVINIFTIVMYNNTNSCTNAKDSLNKVNCQCIEYIQLYIQCYSDCPGSHRLSGHKDK